MNTNKLTGCPLCEADALTNTMQEHGETVGGVRYIATLAAQACGACGEVTFAAADVRAFDHAVVRAVADSGASNGDAIRMLRKAAGLSGKELARLLGIAPETVSRWEHNGQVPDRAAVALLGALAVEAIEGRASTRERLDALAAAVAAPTPVAPVALRVLPSAA